jgi:hypothetical protein
MHASPDIDHQLPIYPQACSNSECIEEMFAFTQKRNIHSEAESEHASMIRRSFNR